MSRVRDVQVCRIVEHPARNTRQPENGFKINFVSHGLRRTGSGQVSSAKVWRFQVFFRFFAGIFQVFLRFVSGFARLREPEKNPKKPKKNPKKT